MAVGLITSLADIVKEIVKAIYDVESITDINFFQFVGTFVLIYVVMRAYMYVVGGD